MKEAFNAVNFEEKDKNYRFIQLEFNAWVRRIALSRCTCLFIRNCTTSQVYNGGDSIWAALVNHLIDGITSISQPHEFQAHMNDVDLWLLKTKRSVIYLAAIAIFLGLVIFAFLLAFDVIGPDIENVAGFTVVFAAFGAIGSAAASVGKVYVFTEFQSAPLHSMALTHRIITGGDKCRSLSMRFCLASRKTLITQPNWGSWAT